MEEICRSNRRKNDGDGSSKAFEDVVGVLDDQRRDEPAEGLDGDDENGEAIEAAEHVTTQHGAPVVRKHCNSRCDGTKEAKLDISDPHRRIAALNNSLEVDSSES